MITYIIDRNIGVTCAGRTSFLTELRGLSTDSKPTDCENGTKFLEMDTKKVYAYNKEGTAWVEI